MKYFVIIVLFNSCRESVESRRAEIKKLISSQNVSLMAEGFYMIGESRDTLFIKDIFKNPDDARCATSLRFQGMSIYQAKMGAMEKFTSIPPPSLINAAPDTAIISFYYKIARDTGWIK